METWNLLSKASLQQLEELDSDLHAKLGYELLEKMRQAFPDLLNDRILVDKGILWWILHNQLEVVSRMETSKRILREIIEKPDTNTSELKGNLVTLSVALNHLKQNLIFLVGELQVSNEGTSQSFYELDAILDAHIMSGDEALKYYPHLIESSLLSPESNSLNQQLGQLGQLLLDLRLETKLVSKITEALNEMLTASERYYAEVAAFSDSEIQATLLFFHFRKVMAAGMYLLSTTIIAETLISTAYYIL
jgi:hypothetical protein